MVSGSARHPPLGSRAGEVWWFLDTEPSMPSCSPAPCPYTCRFISLSSDSLTTS